ncbi:MAG: hypothetical protein ACRC28_08515, partial [Clostridium sp.]
ILKSNVFKELNLPVEDIIEGKYIKALRSSMDIGKSLLNLLDDEKIKEVTGLSIEEIRKLRL